MEKNEFWGYVVAVARRRARSVNTRDLRLLHKRGPTEVGVRAP